MLVSVFEVISELIPCSHFGVLVDDFFGNELYDSVLKWSVKVDDDVEG